MRGGHGDQNSEKHLKIYRVVKQQKCLFKTEKCKYLEWFGPVTEVITLLKWKN